jgi:membrane protein YqaA with SNARE-associated domain
VITSAPLRLRTSAASASVTAAAVEAGTPSPAVIGMTASLGDATASSARIGASMNAILPSPPPCYFGGRVTPQDFIEKWHYAGFIAAAGFAVYQGRGSGVAVVGIVTVATVLGAGILFTLAQRGGRPLLRKYARRFGYTEAREYRIEQWLARRGAPAVVFGRLVPGLRIVMTVVAGTLGMSRATFVVGTFVAGILWGTIYFWIGWAVAAGWGRLAGVG